MKSGWRYADGDQKKTKMSSELAGTQATDLPAMVHACITPFISESPTQLAASNY
jgi:hypothetical protein